MKPKEKAVNLHDHVFIKRQWMGRYSDIKKGDDIFDSNIGIYRALKKIKRIDKNTIRITIE